MEMLGSRNMHSEIVLVANDHTADLVDTLMLRSQSSMLGMLSAKSGIELKHRVSFGISMGRLASKPWTLTLQVDR